MRGERVLAEEATLPQGCEAPQLHKVRLGNDHQTLSYLQGPRTGTLTATVAPVETSGSPGHLSQVYADSR